MQRLVPIAPLLALLFSTACSLVSPEARVRERLIAAGVRPAMADCLAPKLVRKLSRSQLEELGRAVRRPAGGAGDAGPGGIVGRLRAVDDPYVVDVVMRAGLSCAILG